MNQYEAMFLFDPTFGTSFENCESEVKRLMDRAEAEVLFCRKWDERRLAYRIAGRKRGVYVLVYFKAAPDKIAPLERDVQIAENILRILVLRADYITPEMMEQSLYHREVAEDRRWGGSAPRARSAAADVKAKPPKDGAKESVPADGQKDKADGASPAVEGEPSGKGEPSGEAEPRSKGEPSGEVEPRGEGEPSAETQAETTATAQAGESDQADSAPKEAL